MTQEKDRGGSNDPRIIVALDFAEADQARAFVERLQPGSCRLKVGKELFTRAGPELVRELVARGHEVFLDLKFHDIPNTVARACEAAASLGVWMVNVHASGGSRMMVAAREALETLGSERPLLIAVTVLTSLGREDLRELGLDVDPQEQVLRLARLAQAAGLDGVVCSPQEASLLRSELGPDFRLVTPGVRPRGAALDDQTRVRTPGDAVRDGSDYLVIGRPVTRADDPAAVLAGINQELRSLKG
ncbi:MAG TPA: orotidine-5'-phosphate decarboxylase [Gammaproteobacteria bacterium]|nr:orotidine-5'-phosphate decarboxylase [Gammaproteobacteria bacterium]